MNDSETSVSERERARLKIRMVTAPRHGNAQREPLLSLRNPMAWLALRAPYTGEQASRAVRKGLYWFSNVSHLPFIRTIHCYAYLTGLRGSSLRLNANVFIPCIYTRAFARRCLARCRRAAAPRAKRAARLLPPPPT